LSRPSSRAASSKLRDRHDQVAARIAELRLPRGGAFAGEHVRPQTFFRQERVGEVRRIVVDAVLRFDEPSRLDPPHDRIAVRLGQRGVCGHVVQGIAVRKESATLRSAWVLARERELFRIDHTAIVRTRIAQPNGG